MHAYSFTKFIFLREFEADENFDIYSCVQDKRFFFAVWKSLVTTSAAVRGPYATIVNDHRQLYFQHTQYQPFTFTYNQQIGLYESNKIQTSYLNNIQRNFESRLRHFVNRLLNVTEDAALLTDGLVESGATEEEIDEAVRQQITMPAAQFKRAIVRHPSERNDALLRNAYPQAFDQIVAILDLIQPIPLRNFHQNHYTHVKYDPAKYITAFYHLANAFHTNGYREFNWYPLRTSWVPSFVQIDTKILHTKILARTYSGGRSVLFTPEFKIQTWGEVVDLRRQCWKPQNGNGDEVHTFVFRGTVYTDGVSLVIAKQNKNTLAMGGRQAYQAPVRTTQYIDELNVDQHHEIANRCVLIDVGRRDMLYCVLESSTTVNVSAYRYTSNQRRNETKRRRYAKILLERKTNQVTQAELELSHTNSKTLNVGDFTTFLQTRATVWQALHEFYAMIVFRKLRLSAYIRRQQSDERLVKSLRNQFGNDSVLVIGDWSAPHQRHHEPMRGVGMRRMLVRFGCQLYLIDEFRTSKVCPSCSQRSLEHFGLFPNPRPFRTGQVRRWGLLRCTSQQCLDAMTAAGHEGSHRQWNRDLMACLNMRTILLSHREGNDRPEPFVRRQRPDPFQ
ncbi:uncharacterized protein BX664DRAFT_261191 [Halteromyces radiatus]|uniref:uncharacterized protein n=1 Tax=Halteromyces radiatus TaxID=101107 RepID=UPI00221E4710|nr:uncharacterized protein BX664DRAFT_261191 [Halteromyces radiatus]KAI8092844.1 hypothetical protein BX664DRAFT_261191 [Halteromyces radiatus]